MHVMKILAAGAACLTGAVSSAAPNGPALVVTVHEKVWGKVGTADLSAQKILPLRNHGYVVEATVPAGDAPTQAKYMTMKVARQLECAGIQDGEHVSIDPSFQDLIIPVKKVTIGQTVYLKGAVDIDSREWNSGKCVGGNVTNPYSVEMKPKSAKKIVSLSATNAQNVSVTGFQIFKFDAN